MQANPIVRLGQVRYVGKVAGRLGGLLAVLVALTLLTPSGAAASYTVSATTEPPGLATGVQVEAGSNLRITATGTAANCSGCTTAPDGTPGLKSDPQAVLPTSPVGALLANIVGTNSSSGWFYVGTEFNDAAPASGELHLLYNDVPGEYSNNSGAYSVDVIHGGGFGAAMNSVYVANSTGSASQFTIGTGGALTGPNTVDAGPQPSRVAVTPDGQHVYVTDHYDGHVYEYDVNADGSLTSKAMIASEPGSVGIPSLRMERAPT